MLFGTILIEVCDANRAYTDVIMNLEHEFPGVSVLENACMSQCELCAEGPYVFFNGELISRETVEELHSELIHRITQHDNPEEN